MLRYRYIGSNPFLYDETALGQIVSGVFKVQVDRFDHPWSHLWHITPEKDWCEIDNGRVAQSAGGACLKNTTV